MFSHKLIWCSQMLLNTFCNACVVGCVGICVEGGQCLFVPSVAVTSWMYHGHNNMLPWLEARLSELVSLFT